MFDSINRCRYLKRQDFGQKKYIFNVQVRKRSAEEDQDAEMDR